MKPAKTPETFIVIMDQRIEHAQIKLDGLRGIFQCPPHEFAWRIDGKAECVKCGRLM